jgi:hypothetical protein
MVKENVGQKVTEIVIDKLVGQFHDSVTVMANDSGKYSEMLALLKGYNPLFSARRY